MFHSVENSLLAGDAMPTLLLIFCLMLNGSNSCPGRVGKNISQAPSQSDVAVLNTLLEQIDSCDEPALRVFLRLKIATYLWSNSSGLPQPESLATAALADLRANEKEIPTIYVDQFRRNLMAELTIHAPDLAARLAEEYQPGRPPDFGEAYSLLSRENGVDKAVAIVQNNIVAGKDPGHIIVPFLHRLESVKPAEVPKLLETIILEEESHPDSISSGTLFVLKHLFIREKTSQDLQRRYLVAVINRASEKDARLASVVDTYGILADVLPKLEKDAPDLYYSASAALSRLRERMPRGTLERIAIDKRVNESSDPLSQLMAEKDAVTDPSLKEDLQIEGAQLALEKGQIRTAIELVVSLKPKNDDAGLWRDQFLEGAVTRAIDKGDVGIAEYGTSQIKTVAVRLSALQKIATYLQTSNDQERARDTLNSALKSVKALDDSANKAIALLDLANSFLKIDNRQASELVRAAIKVINKEPEARKREAGSNVQLNDVEDTMKIAYKVIPTFQALGVADESAALDLAKDIRPKGLRIAAMFGAYTRLPAAGKDGSRVASK
jgi:hypothetical protein